MILSMPIKNEYYTGIYLKILHSFTFTVMSLLMAYYSKNLFAVQEFFFIAFFGTIISLLVLLVTGQAISFRLSKRQIILYSLRGATGFVSMVSWIEAINFLGINEAMSLSYATPFWLVLAAIISCKEKIGKKDIIILGLNTIGMILIVRPQAEQMTMLGVLAALLATMLWAVHDTVCKKLASEERQHSTLNMRRTFYAFSFSSLISLPFALYYWQPVSLGQISGLGIVASVSVVNLTVLFLAYVYAPIVVLIPFGYSRLIIAAIFAYFLYDIWPSAWCFVGAGLIIVANLCFYMMQRVKNCG